MSLATGDVINYVIEPGIACTLSGLDQLLATHKPAVLFICQGECNLQPVHSMG